jgi:lipopolysaccharide biosynthesis glycosyltransferase
MDYKDKIIITMATNDNYVDIMLVSMVSILVNNPKEYMVFNIIDDGITEKSIEKIQKKVLYVYSNVEINYINFTPYKIKLETLIQKANPPLPLITYARLFISEMLNKYNKTLYVDCDTVCVGDIRPLWEINIGSTETIYGVLDTVSDNIKKEIGLTKGDKYINAGVLLIDLKKWRENNFTEKAMKFIQKYDGKVMHNDQGVINGAFNKEIKIIDIKYNLMTPIFMISRKKILQYFDMENFYTNKEITTAKKHGVFLHFVRFTTSRPWEKKCRHPEKSEFISIWKKAKLGTLYFQEYNISKPIFFGYFLLENTTYSIYKMYLKIVGVGALLKKQLRG